jgi:hypothetical protein
MYNCQCKGCQNGQNNGVLIKKVAAFQRCSSLEVPCILYTLYFSCGFILAVFVDWKPFAKI